MTLLTLSASVSGLKPQCDAKNACDPTELQTAVFFVGLYLIALGTGGIKPCLSSFGADQFDDSDESEIKKKGSFFNWFYFSINIGALVASCSCLGPNKCHVNCSGVSCQVHGCTETIGLEGVLTGICQVLFASFRKFRVQVPSDKSLLYETRDEESAVKGSRKLDHTKPLR